MPGVLGIVARTKRAEARIKTDFEGMVKLLMHRDCYRLSTCSRDHFIIGVLELPFRGHAGMRFEQASQRGVVFHGYLYGWRGAEPVPNAARADPATVIPLGIDVKLAEVPAMLNGSFALGLYDLTADEFLFATDKLGYRRIYYYQDEELVAVAPELKAFLALSSFRARLDESGAASLLSFGCVIGDGCLLDGVKLLRPGSILRISQRRQLAPIRYYAPSFSEELDGDGDSLARDALTLAENVFERQLGGREQTIVSLSGGMDSRLLAYLMSRSTRKARYYTHGPQRCEDVVIAREVATALGVRDMLTEIRQDPECYWKLGAWTAWLVDGMVGIGCSSGVHVITRYKDDPINCEFFNSIYTGAMNFASAYSSEVDITDALDREEKMRRIGGILGAPLAANVDFPVLTDAFLSFCRDRSRQFVIEELEIAEGRGRSFANQKDAFFLETRIWRLSNQYELYKYFFHDHFALIDDEFLEFYFRMPLRWRVSRRLYYKLYQDLLPALARIRYQKTGVDLYGKPSVARIAWRSFSQQMRYYVARATGGRINVDNRRLYANPDKWYRDHRRNRRFIEELLVDGECASRGFLDARGLRRMLDAERRGMNCFYVLENLAALELFVRQFIGGEVPSRPF